MVLKKWVIASILTVGSLVFLTGCLDAAGRGFTVGITDGVSGGLSTALETLIVQFLTGGTG